MKIIFICAFLRKKPLYSAKFYSKKSDLFYPLLAFQQNELSLHNLQKQRINKKISKSIRQFQPKTFLRYYEQRIAYKWLDGDL